MGVKWVSKARGRRGVTRLNFDVLVGVMRIGLIVSVHSL